MQYTRDQLQLFARTGLVPRSPRAARQRPRRRRRRERQRLEQTVPLPQRPLSPHEYLKLEFVASDPIER